MKGRILDCVFFWLCRSAAASLLRKNDEHQVYDTSSSARKSDAFARSRQVTAEVPDELRECENNLKAADSSSDGVINKAEFGSFVSLHSGGRVHNPTTDYDIMIIFFAESCIQCLELTQDNTCCVGARAGIVIDPTELEFKDYLETLYYVCKSVDLQIAILFPPESPAASPSDEPSQSPNEATSTSIPTTASLTRSPISPPITAPTNAPTSISPTRIPSLFPVPTRTPVPTEDPTTPHTLEPISTSPMNSPAATNPLGKPSSNPTGSPSKVHPTGGPTTPIAVPTSGPVPEPSIGPSEFRQSLAPTRQSGELSSLPSFLASAYPSVLPSLLPTTLLSSQPSEGTPFELLISTEFSLPENETSCIGSVAVSHDYLAVGWPCANDWNGLVQTHVSGGVLPDLNASGALKFGSAVKLKVNDLGEPHLLVGATETKEINGTRKFGSVDYFQYDGEEWERVGPILPPAENLEENGEFGFAVALASSNQRIAIGAPFSKTRVVLPRLDLFLLSGRVYTFEYNGSEWVQMAPPLVGNLQAMAGSSLDMSDDGSRLLVGAPAFEGGDGGVGYYKWDEDKKIWESIFSFTLSKSDEALGTSAIIISGNRWISFGGPSFGNNQGVIRVFQETENSDSLFTQVGTDIIGSDGERIGNTLSGTGERITFGTDTLIIRVYDYDGENWEEAASINVPFPISDLALAEDGRSVTVAMEGGTTHIYEIVRKV